MNTVVTALTASVGDIQTQELAAIGAVLPVALVIAGASLVIFIGWKLFKRLAK